MNILVRPASDTTACIYQQLKHANTANTRSAAAMLEIV